MKTALPRLLICILLLSACTSKVRPPETVSKRIPSSTIDPSEKISFKVHTALYETFFPFDELKTKMEAAENQEEKDKLALIIQEAQDRIAETYHEVRRMEEMKIMHTLYSNLDILTSPVVAGLYYNILTQETEEAKKRLWKETKDIRLFVKELKIKKKKVILNFYHLTVPEREELLVRMNNSGLNYLRRLSFSTKLLYNSKIYRGKLATLISGVETEPHRFDPNFYNPDHKFTGHKLSYNKNKNQIEGELDYIVVGSGVSASVIVNRLHRAGKKVLVVEKGSFIYPGAINARDNFDFLDSHGLRGDNDGSMFFLNGSTVGGGSTVNIDMSYPPTLPYIKNNFEKWREKGLIPKNLWTQDDLKSAQNWVQGLFNVRTVHEDEYNRNNQLLLKGALGMGMEETDDQYDLYRGIQKYRLFTNEAGEENLVEGKSIKATDKKSVVEKLLWAPLMNEPGADYDGQDTYAVALESDATVTEVLQDKTGKTNRAIGVEFLKSKAWDHAGIIKDPSGLNIPAGKKVKVFAKNVILAAGNLGTSVILLKSHINNKNIGRGFTSHPFLPIVGFFDEVINAHIGTPSTIYIDHYLTKEKDKPRPNFLIESAAGNADLGGVLVPGTSRQVYEAVENLKHIGGLGVILVEETNPENRIELKGDKTVIFHNLSESDRRRFAHGVAEGIRILFKAGAKKVSFVSYENVFKRENNSDFKFFTNIEEANYVEMNMRFTENQSLIMGAHMLGANKLGTDPKNSVVDPNHQVWGVNNLFVVDASVFPTSPGANPMQSIYAISKIFVDRHLEAKRRNK